MDRSRTLKPNHMFSRVIQKGRSASSATVALYALANYRKAAPTLIGVSASAKLGGAVKRNRAKRIVRAAAGGLYGQLRPGWLIIAIARAPCFDPLTKSDRVARDMRYALSKLGLLK